MLVLVFCFFILYFWYVVFNSFSGRIYLLIIVGLVDWRGDDDVNQCADDHQQEKIPHGRRY